MSKKLLRDIIWRGQSKWNFAFAGLGFLLGFLFLLLGVQLYHQVYRDIRKEVRAGELSEFLTIQKRIVTANTLGLGNPAFRSRELRDLESQPFVEAMGPFQANRFTALMSMERFADLQMLLPMESVREDFFDTIPERWGWQEGDRVVPVMLSSEFLNVYNAVLAPSMNYPRFTREMVTNYPLRLELQGKGRRELFEVRVTGFSDRFVSVLVPEDFLTWANRTFAGTEKVEPTRVMIKVADPGDTRLSTYLESKDYITNTDRLKGTASSAVQALLSVLLALGLLFLILALIIFTMAYQLIVSRAQAELRLLITLGYTLRSLTRAVAGYYAPFIGLISLAGIGLVAVMSGLMRSYLEGQGYAVQGGLHPTVWIAFLIFNLVVSGLSLFIIRRAIRRLY